MQLVLKREKKQTKKKYPKRNLRKLWSVHQERKVNPTHKKYGHLAPSVPNNKGMSFS